MTSKRKNEELLKKQIAKLSADNTSFHKEIDVMHSAMSDLHKRYDRAREIINQMRMVGVGWGFRSAPGP